METNCLECESTLEGIQQCTRRILFSDTLESVDDLSAAVVKQGDTGASELRASRARERVAVVGGSRRDGEDEGYAMRCGRHLLCRAMTAV